MSDMEIFYGTYEKTTRDVPDDWDERNDLEADLDCIFAQVDGVWYEARQIEKLDSYGFSIVIPPSTESRIMCYWYNGGAHVTEVLESAIRSQIMDGTP